MESLRFPTPNSPAAIALNALLDQRASLHARVADAEHAGTFASREQLAASDALAKLEHRRATGENVPDVEVKRAEKAVTVAKARANEPWSERAAGLRSALRDTDQAVQHHVAEHWDALASELAQDANAAARDVDEALRQLDRAYQAREEVAGRFNAFVASVRGGRGEPGLIPESNVERLVQDAAAVLMAGGEVAPVPRRDPRAPRHGQPVEVTA